MTAYIDAGILNFTGSYVTPSGIGETYGFGSSTVASCATQWTDTVSYGWESSEDPGWGICYPGYLNQIYTDDSNVYAVYSEGLDIIDIFSEGKIAYIDHTYGFTTVCGDSDRVYLGTLTSGIKYIDKTCISGSATAPYDLISCLYEFNSAHLSSTARIRSLFTNSSVISVTTLGGLDVIGLLGQGFKSSTVCSGIVKSFVTNKRELYYISYANVWQINKVNSYLVDWSEPDKVYRTDNSFFLGDVVIRDIFVTESTSSDGTNNTLFVATSSGTYVLDEGTDTVGIYQ